MSNPDTLNRYLYVDDDPVNQVDPSGAASCFVAVLEAGVAVSGYAQGGAALATFVLTAIGGPIGFLVGLLISGAAIYISLATLNDALQACGLSKYEFPLPF